MWKDWLASSLEPLWTMLSESQIWIAMALQHWRPVSVWQALE
jgi:hypothetical protein